MDGRFFRSFAEAEMGVIQVNTSKNTSKIKIARAKFGGLRENHYLCSVGVRAVVMTALYFFFHPLPSNIDFTSDSL